MYQTWEDLLFLHWEADYNEIKKSLPAGLTPDNYNNKTYVGITPFYLHSLRLPLLPSLPGVSSFFETNVRTYVFDENGTPGVWFYSLDANEFLAVKAANLIPLPYKLAEISVKKEFNIIDYKIKRDKTELQSEFIYKPEGETFYPDSETLEFFLAERYFLFFIDSKNNLRKIRVNHSPYPLQKVEVIKEDCHLINLDGIKISSFYPVHAIFSSGPGEVKIYSPEKV
jgi:uncharacterized protein YqjF (DUF2071 family)